MSISETGEFGHFNNPELTGEEIALQIYTPSIEVLGSLEAVDQRAADIVVKQIKNKPNSVLTVPTGSTPIDIYKNLVQAYREGLDFSQLTILNLDEYHPIQPDHPSSYAHFMRTHLIRHINIDQKNWHIPDGTYDNPDHSAAQFQEILSQYQPDLAILGIGPGQTCHIGFNERGSEADSCVRYVQLDPQTKKANMQHFENPNEMPTGAITQGIADILQAEHILLIAKGAHKAWGIQRSLAGEIGSDAPASFLRYHPDVTVLLDAEAATLLVTV